MDQFIGVDGGHSPGRGWQIDGCSWLWISDLTSTPLGRLRMDGLLVWWSDLRDPVETLRHLRTISIERGVPLVVVASPDAIPEATALEEGLVDAVVDPAWPPAFSVRCLRLAMRATSETSNILDIQSAVMEAAREEVADLYDRALIDSLSGLFNIGHLRESLDRVHQDAERATKPYTVVFIDVDDLKEINTRHGHAAGSRLVQEVGKIIRDCKRNDDLAFRYGGDEFVVLLPGAGAEDGCNFGSRLLARIRGQRLPLGGESVGMSVTLGLATFPKDAPDPDALLMRADAAMGVAKKAGKNRAGCFSDRPCGQWLPPGVVENPCPVEIEV